MGIEVAVVGASGYAGAELLRLLDAHPDLTLGPVVAHSHAGSTLGDVAPQLTSLADRRLLTLDEADLDSVDLVFTALPHGSSAPIADALPESTKVVDLGADFRLADADAWSSFYDGDHAGTWTYGLPELPGARAAIAASARVASPGCYATAITLAFAPIVEIGLLSPGSRPVLSVVAASGASGAGRSLSERLLGAEVMGDLSVYKVAGQHQHIAEIEQSLGRLTAIDPVLSFTPVLAPMPRGILAVCSAEVADGVSAADVRSALLSSYDGEPFVRVLPGGQWPRTSSVLGSNTAHLQGDVDRHAGRAVIVATIDNLGKGAAGQAIQNANLMLGFDEGSGLTRNGTAP